MSDIRAGGIPTNAKLMNQLVNRHGESLEEKSLTICSGTDYININYQHVICPDAATAKVCVCSFNRYVLSKHLNKIVSLQLILVCGWFHRGGLCAVHSDILTEIIICK